jgi:uncharacterized protein (DUF2141 family)
VPIMPAIRLNQLFAIACGVCAACGTTVLAQPQIQRVPLVTPVVVNAHGAAIAALPDVNGDGKADFAVSSLFAVGNVGRVYIYSGATGQVIRQIVSPLAEADGYFGNSLAAVPDVNGDGVADVVVGGPNDSPGTSPVACGRAYIYSGATGQLLAKLLPPGGQLGGQFGYAVTGFADIDGDGRGDVAVGAPGERHSQSGNDDGRVHIYSGATGQRVRTIVFNASHSGDFGHSLATINDLNGDGKQEIIVGSPRARADRGGEAYVYSPVTGAKLRTMWSVNSQDDGRFGYAVSAVPDANGDGVPDVIVGAPREFGRSGRAYLFSGATGAIILQVRSPGVETDGRFGEAVTGLPDFNGDGRGDFVIGAAHEDPGFSQSDNGRAYIYSGATGQFLHKLIPPVNRAEEYFGAALAALPDVNGTGKPEIVVGAPGDDSPTYGHSGATFIYRY